MREFFKGWRRKAAIAVLGLACVFMGMWFRSLNSADVVRFRVFRYRRTVYSIDGQMHWRWWLGMRRTFKIRIGIDREKAVQEMDTAQAMNTVDNYRGNLLGTISTDDCFRETVVPYWLALTPLTAISAYLLLSKPRPTKPVAPPEQNPPDGDSLPHLRGSGDKLGLFRSMTPREVIQLSSPKTRRLTFVDGCFWFLYLGILLPTLGVFGFWMIQMSLVDANHRRPPPEPILFLVGAAVFGFAILRATRLMLTLIRPNRQDRLAETSDEPKPSSPDAQKI